MKCLSSAAGWAEPDLNSTHVFLSQGKALPATAAIITVDSTFVLKVETTSEPLRGEAGKARRTALHGAAAVGTCIDLRRAWVDR
jgi:hypothetical protein